MFNGETLSSYPWSRNHETCNERASCFTNRASCSTDRASCSTDRSSGFTDRASCFTDRTSYFSNRARDSQSLHHAPQSQHLASRSGHRAIQKRIRSQAVSLSKLFLFCLPDGLSVHPTTMQYVLQSPIWLGDSENLRDYTDLTTEELASVTHANCRTTLSTAVKTALAKQSALLSALPCHPSHLRLVPQLFCLF